MTFMVIPRGRSVTASGVGAEGASWVKKGGVRKSDVFWFRWGGEEFSDHVPPPQTPSGIPRFLWSAFWTSMAAESGLLIWGMEFKYGKTCSVGVGFLSPGKSVGAYEGRFCRRRRLSNSRTPRPLPGKGPEGGNQGRRKFCRATACGYCSSYMPITLRRPYKMTQRCF